MAVPVRGIFNTQFGFILDSGCLKNTLHRMKAPGLSKTRRRFIYHTRKNMEQVSFTLTVAQE